MVVHWWGQVPELAWVDVTVWGRLWWPVEDWLKLCPDGHGEIVRCHPLLSSMQIAYRGEGMLV